MGTIKLPCAPNITHPNYPGGGGGGEGGGGTATVASPAPLMPSGTARKLQLQKFEIPDAVFFPLLLHFWLLYFVERF